MKYSVILSNTRAAGKFEESITKICEQDIDDYEVLLPDFDDFTPEERAIIKELQKKYAHFKVVPGKGDRIEMLNEAARQAQGDYLMFLETHCTAPKDLLRTYTTYFEKGEVAVLGDVRAVSCGTPTSAFETATKNVLRDTDGFWDSHNVAIKKETFSDLAGLDPSVGYMAEFEFGARLHKAGIPIAKMPVAVEHHCEDDAASYGKTVRKQGAGRISIYNKHGKTFSDKYFPHKFSWIATAPRWQALLVRYGLHGVRGITYAGHELSVKAGLSKPALWFFKYYAIGSVLLGMTDERKKEENKLLKQIKTALFITPPLPKQVDIEIATVCNLHCKMCKREEFDFGNQLMPLNTFKEIVDRIPREVEWISFGGYGEMLMHPKFVDMVRYAKARGFKTDTTSNGTLLNTDEKIKRLFASGLDTIRFSIDHVRAPTEEKEVGHVFDERLLKNLKRISELREETGSPIELGINTVVHKGNIDEVIDIVKYGEDLGFDLVNFIRLDTCMNKAERTLSFEKEKKVYKQVEKMKKTIRVITPANRFAGLKKLYHLRQEFCIFRYQSAHIRMNGEVTPCAFGFATHDCGNIKEKTLKDIWDDMKPIRSTDKHPTCQSCAIFKWGKL